jgi:hypothetical protein
MEEEIVSNYISHATNKDKVWQDLTSQEIMLHFNRRDLSAVKFGKALSKLPGIKKTMIRGVAHYGIKQIIKQEI